MYLSKTVNVIHCFPPATMFDFLPLYIHIRIRGLISTALIPQTLEVPLARSPDWHLSLLRGSWGNQGLFLQPDDFLHCGWVLLSTSWFSGRLHLTVTPKQPSLWTTTSSAFIVDDHSPPLSPLISMSRWWFLRWGLSIHWHPENTHFYIF